MHQTVKEGIPRSALRLRTSCCIYVSVLNSQRERFHDVKAVIVVIFVMFELTDGVSDRAFVSKKRFGIRIGRFVRTPVGSKAEFPKAFFYRN